MQLVIVTGMSGAGKSRAMDSLEDIGFFCVDTMTPELIPTFVQILTDSAQIREKVAIAVDARLGESFSRLFSALDELKNIVSDFFENFSQAIDKSRTMSDGAKINLHIAINLENSTGAVGSPMIFDGY